MTQYNILVRRPEHLAQWLCDPEAYATTLVTLALDITGGTECLQWHPRVLREEIEQAGRCRLPEDNFNRLMAAVTILTTDLFYTDLPAFITLANTLSFGPFEPTIFDPADAFECAWAVAEALLLDPPEPDEQGQVVAPFAPSIVAYIERILRDEGLLTVPKVLRGIIDPDSYVRNNRFQRDDDPELFAAVYQYKQSLADDIDQMVEENLAELLTQLQQLPLTHRAVATPSRNR